jgi:hypothetical protein
MTIVIRGFIGQKCVFEDTLDLDTQKELEAIIPQIATKHAELLMDSPHMIEMEFLDDPDPASRFFRFGTDPRGMVLPVELNLPPSPEGLPATGADATGAAATTEDFNGGEDDTERGRR